MDTWFPIYNNEQVGQRNPFWLIRDSSRRNIILILHQENKNPIRLSFGILLSRGDIEFLNWLNQVLDCYLKVYVYSTASNDSFLRILSMCTMEDNQIIFTIMRIGFRMYCILSINNTIVRVIIYPNQILNSYYAYNVTGLNSNGWCTGTNH